MLRQRTRNLTDNAMRIRTLRDSVLKDLQTVETELSELTARNLLLLKVAELFRMLLDRMVSDRVRAIEALVTEGLQAIFHDQQLVFESEIGVKYNKTSVEFFFKQGTGDTAIVGAPLDAFGGGPSSVASLLLRIMALLRLGKAPLLVLDETLAAVSEEYVEATGRFLSQLAQTVGVDVLLVTHKSAFLDQARRSYQGSEKEVDTGFRSLILRESKVT